MNKNTNFGLLLFIIVLSVSVLTSILCMRLLSNLEGEKEDKVLAMSYVALIFTSLGLLCVAFSKDKESDKMSKSDFNTLLLFILALQQQNPNKEGLDTKPSNAGTQNEEISDELDASTELKSANASNSTAIPTKTLS